jgi:hypothetical protein
MRLEAAGVSDDSQMYILMRLLGGAKKRKKKTYTKPRRPVTLAASPWCGSCALLGPPSLG